MNIVVWGYILGSCFLNYIDQLSCHSAGSCDLTQCSLHNGHAADSGVEYACEAESDASNGSCISFVFHQGGGTNRMRAGPRGNAASHNL